MGVVWCVVSSNRLSFAYCEVNLARVIERIAGRIQKSIQSRTDIDVWNYDHISPSCEISCFFICFSIAPVQSPF